MHPIAVGILASLILVLLFAPRRWALLAMMAGILYLTSGSSLELLGVNFQAMRFLEVAGFIRIFARKEYANTQWNGVDRAFVLVYVYTTAIFLLRSSLGYGTSAHIEQVGNMDRIGAMVDAGLLYLIFRTLIRSTDDLVTLLSDFALLLIPFVMLLWVERTTGQNPFMRIGGVASFNDGIRFRAVGSFSHPSLMGTLGASFLPLYVALAIAQRFRPAALVGIGMCVAIVIFCNSGGPAGFAALSLAAWGFWIIRERMRLVRWGIVVSLLLIALFMKAPIWYLPGKMSLILGGDGWHRSRLMEVAFQDISHWWLAGMPLDLTRDWFMYSVGGAGDITNLYLKFGLDAGLPAMIFFIVLLVRAFRQLGQALSLARSSSNTPTANEYLLWGLGAMLVGHISNWFAITYFDQSQVVWYMQCAAIASIAGVQLASESGKVAGLPQAQVVPATRVEAAQGRSARLARRVSGSRSAGDRSQPASSGGSSVPPGRQGSRRTRR